MRIKVLHKDEEYVKHALGIAIFWLMDADYVPEGMKREKAAKVFDANYQHGGGWRPGLSGSYKLDTKTGIYKYPGDPPQKPLARIEFGDEVVWCYDHAMWAVVQPDGSFEIARMD